jgi:hypothetical protein
MVLSYDYSIVPFLVSQYLIEGGKFSRCRHVSSESETALSIFGHCAVPIHRLLSHFTPSQ